MIGTIFKISQVYSGPVLGETTVPGAVPSTFMYNRKGPHGLAIGKGTTKHLINKEFNSQVQDAQSVDYTGVDSSAVGDVD